jgi:hypothetical protein
LGIEIAIHLERGWILLLAWVVLLVGLEVAQLCFQVVDLGWIAALPRLVQLRSELGEVGVDVLQGGGVFGSVQLRAAGLASLPPFGGNRPEPCFPCQSGWSPRVCVIRRFRLLALLAVVCLAGCRSNAPSLQERERMAKQQQLLELCLRVQPRLPGALQRLNAAQQELASVRAATYLPSAPPKPLDPEEQRRLTIYDQQTEQDLYEQAVESWRRAEADRRERWEKQQSERESNAVSALNGAVQSLQQLHPELLRVDSPPQLNDEEVERFRTCKPERFR